MKSWLIPSAFVAFLAVACVSSTRAVEIVGTVSPTPVGEHTCIAVQLQVEPGASMAGITWFHNDELVTFPTLLIVEGIRNAPPDLTETALVLGSLSGGSLSWGSATFQQPVTTQAEAVYAVFELPAYVEHTGDGLGGGPALGYGQGAGPGRAYVSPDGSTWVRVRDTVALGVEVSLVAGKSPDPPMSLGGLRAQRPRGWWDEVGRASEQVTDREVVPPAEVGGGLTLSAQPNPFNPRTTISYALPRSDSVSLVIFDVRGRLVRQLFDGTQSAGEHSHVWNGEDRRGSRISSGVYFVRLETSAQTRWERVVLVR